MRWDDERYVRLYTRDTPTWLALSFDAQALFALLLRKVDRAGILPLGGLGKRAVAIVLGQGGLWDSRLSPALEELQADGCVVVRGDELVIRNFVEAQETRQTDAARRRASREKANARKDFPSGDAAEEGHRQSPLVTSGHQRSLQPSRAEPYRAVKDVGAGAPQPPSASADRADQPSNREPSEPRALRSETTDAASQKPSDHRERADEPKSKPPRKPPREAAFIAWAREARDKAHPTAGTDQPFGNARAAVFAIRPVLTELGDPGARAAYLKYLTDRGHPASLKPPWPIQFFASQWRRYQSGPGPPAPPKSQPYDGTEDLYPDPLEPNGPA